MKKFYTIALAALAGVSSMFAADLTLKNAEKANATFMGRKATTVEAAALSRAASDYDSYTWTLKGNGVYIASAVAGCYGASTDATSVQVYEADGHPGVYKAVGVWADMVSGGAELIVDCSDPTFIEVPIQLTPINDTVDGITRIASLNSVLAADYDKELILSQLPDACPSMANDIITFPAECLVLNWPEAPADSKYGTDPTEWYAYGTNEGALYLPGAEYVEPWEEVGTGIFTDNSFSALFGAAPAPYEVTVQKSTQMENYYRILHPWKGFYDLKGYSGTSAPLELETSDPDNVLVPMAETGVQATGIGFLTIFNDAFYSLLLAANGYEYEEPEAYTTMTEEDNTITFTFQPKSLLVVGDQSDSMYYAGSRLASTVVVTKQSSGVEGVVAADKNAPVEYFNLQGVRVANPENGVFIRRQGNAVSKVVK